MAKHWDTGIDTQSYFTPILNFHPQRHESILGMHVRLIRPYFDKLQHARFYQIQTEDFWSSAQRI